MKNKIKKFLAGLGIISAATLGGKTLQKPAYTAPPEDFKPANTALQAPRFVPQDIGYVLGTVTNEDGSAPTPAQLTLAKSSVSKAATVVRSNCYRTNTYSFSFTETNGLSNAGIYSKFTESPITINIQFFYGSWAQNHWYRTMGYDIGDGVVYANTYFIDNSDDLASLEMHEDAHGLGFSHYSANDYLSVPYGQNTLFDKCNGKP